MPTNEASVYLEKVVKPLPNLNSSTGSIPKVSTQVDVSNQIQPTSSSSHSSSSSNSSRPIKSISFVDNPLYKLRGQKWSHFFESSSSVKSCIEEIPSTIAEVKQRAPYKMKQVQRLNGNDMHYYGIAPKQTALEVVVCNYCSGVYKKVGLKNHMTLHHPNILSAVPSKIMQMIPGEHLNLQPTDATQEIVRDIINTDIAGSPSSGTMSTCSNASSSSLSSTYTTSRHKSSEHSSSSSSMSSSSSRSRSKSKHRSCHFTPSAHSSPSSSINLELSQSSSKSSKKSSSVSSPLASTIVTSSISTSSNSNDAIMASNLGGSKLSSVLDTIQPITVFSSSSNSSCSLPPTPKMVCSIPSETSSVSNEYPFSPAGLITIKEPKEKFTGDPPSTSNISSKKKIKSPLFIGQESVDSLTSNSSAECERGSVNTADLPEKPIITSVSIINGPKIRTEKTITIEEVSKYVQNASEIQQAVQSITREPEKSTEYSNMETGTSNSKTDNNKAQQSTESRTDNLTMDDDALPDILTLLPELNFTSEEGSQDTMQQLNQSEDTSMLTLDDMLDSKFINELLNNSTPDITFDENAFDMSTQQNKMHEPPAKRMRFEDQADAMIMSQQQQQNLSQQNLSQQNLSQQSLSQQNQQQQNPQQQNPQQQNQQQLQHVQVSASDFTIICQQQPQHSKQQIQQQVQSPQYKYLIQPQSPLQVQNVQNVNQNLQPQTQVQVPPLQPLQQQQTIQIQHIPQQLQSNFFQQHSHLLQQQHTEEYVHFEPNSIDDSFKISTNDQDTPLTVDYPIPITNAIDEELFLILNQQMEQDNIQLQQLERVLLLQQEHFEQNQFDSLEQQQLEQQQLEQQQIEQLLIDQQQQQFEQVEIQQPEIELIPDQKPDTKTNNDLSFHLLFEQNSMSFDDSISIPHGFEEPTGLILPFSSDSENNDNISFCSDNANSPLTTINSEINETPINTIDAHFQIFSIPSLTDDTVNEGDDMVIKPCIIENGRTAHPLYIPTDEQLIYEITDSNQVAVLNHHSSEKLNDLFSDYKIIDQIDLTSDDEEDIEEDEEDVEDEYINIDDITLPPEVSGELFDFDITHIETYSKTPIISSVTERSSGGSELKYGVPHICEGNSYGLVKCAITNTPMFWKDSLSTRLSKYRPAAFDDNINGLSESSSTNTNRFNSTSANAKQKDGGKNSNNNATAKISGNNNAGSSEFSISSITITNPPNLSQHKSQNSPVEITVNITTHPTNNTPNGTSSSPVTVLTKSSRPKSSGNSNAIANTNTANNGTSSKTKSTSSSSTPTITAPTSQSNNHNARNGIVYKGIKCKPVKNRRAALIPKLSDYKNGIVTPKLIKDLIKGKNLRSSSQQQQQQQQLLLDNHQQNNSNVSNGLPEINYPVLKSNEKVREFYERRRTLLNLTNLSAEKRKAYYEQLQKNQKASNMLTKKSSTESVVNVVLSNSNSLSSPTNCDLSIFS